MPQTGGDLSAVAHYYLHLPDKTMKEVTVPLNGAGIQPVVIRLALPNTNYTQTPYQKINIPVQVLDASVVTVSQIDFSVNLNTNLLSPQSFDFTGSVINGSSALLGVNNTRTTVTITVTPPQKISAGLLGTFIFLPYVTDTLTTPIVLNDFTLLGADNSKDCLPTSIVIPPESITSFSLSTACGDSSISRYMKYGITGIKIQSIIPNPTSSKITVSIAISPGYQNDGYIEIFDALGNLVQSEPLLTLTGEKEVTRSIDLEGASGLRILRVRSPQGTSSQGVYLLK